MNKKLNFIEKWINKYIIDEKWWVNILVGIVAAVLMPKLLPLRIEEIIKNSDPGDIRTINEFIWATFCIFIIEFVKKVISIPERVEKYLDKHVNEITRASLTGFYRLLASEDIKKFESQFQGATEVDSPFRGVLLDFIVSSLANFGKNGFALVDAEVSDYVEYSVKIIDKCQQVVMTCVVRPYWVVIDGIQGVCLHPYKVPPYQSKSIEFGKSEHLRYFEQGKGVYQRWLIVDENMLSEIFLTAYIDRYFVKNIDTKLCPVCQLDISDNLVKCPFHQNRLVISNINDIPEIWWFKNQVNQSRGVKLIYTLIRGERRKLHEELEDRVFINKPKLDIRFNFINLEKGILRIRWGNEARSLAYIDDSMFDTRINPETCLDDQEKGHKFYGNFKDIFRENIKEKMIVQLNILRTEVDKYFNPINVGKIGGQSAQQIKKLLAKGNPNFKELIDKVIDILIYDLDKQSLNKIYDSLIEFYNASTGIPKIAYVIINDPSHPEYPIRVARWKANWDGDGDSNKGILNIKKVGFNDLK